MEEGNEFPSWERFNYALEKYSRDQKVSFFVAVSKSVESANCLDWFQPKIPSKFKYCFARFVCMPLGTANPGKRNQEKTCQTGCQASIFISVNKKRTALVIKEANLVHSHSTKGTVVSSSALDHQLQAEDRHIASVLLRAGVPLARVQQFVSGHGSESGQEGVKDNSYLSELDNLMSQDSQLKLKMIDFDQKASAIYFQTSAMTKQMTALSRGQLQITVKHVAEECISIVHILGIDADSSSLCSLAFCIIISNFLTSLKSFFELFVQNNPSFCDEARGIVVDCSKEALEFLKLLFPQAVFCWSQSYVLAQFNEECTTAVGEKKNDVLQVYKNLMNSESSDDYDQQLKDLQALLSPSLFKEFLRSWDSYREFWVQYEISQNAALLHQELALEQDFYSMLDSYVQPDLTLSRFIKNLFAFENGEEIEDHNAGVLMHKFDPDLKSYRTLCFPEAFHVISCEMATAQKSIYEIKQQTDMIFVKRKDSDDEFMLELDGQQCTCRQFVDSDLPCQHIFAWLISSQKPLYSESLVPARYQVFGESLTLAALAESLSQGQVPSSRHHDERLKELQHVLKDTLTACCSHSYARIGQDLALLRQVLNIMKSGTTDNAKILAEEGACFLSSRGNLQTEADTQGPVVPRKRGRPRKKDKVEEMVTTNPVSKPRIHGKPAPRHNLRTNIKHKFVTRDIGWEEKDDRGNRRAEGQLGKENAPVRYSSKSNTQTLTGNDLVQGSGSLEMKDSGDALVNAERESLICESGQEEEEVSALKKLPPDEQDLDTPLLGKRPYPFSGRKNMNAASDNSDEDDDEEEEEAEDDLSEDRETNFAKMEARRLRLEQDMETYLLGLSHDSVQEMMSVVSKLQSPEDRALSVQEDAMPLPDHPADVLLKTNEELPEVIESIINNLRKEHIGHDKFHYQVAACIVSTAFHTGHLLSEIWPTVSEWPDHLPHIPAARMAEGPVTLNPDLSLTVSGHKLSASDLETLQPQREINSNVIHAYLDVLAQKHSGKMFVIPFDVIHHWRHGTYGDMIFKKVHFKTFEYLVLPIHCGAELTEEERLSGEVITPFWMVLVADVQNKKVAVMNPNQEDRYKIAANGYMLHWRRYMQIRSVHTREMLSAWSTGSIPCSRQVGDFSSGALLLMNVEALINDVPPVVMTEAHVSRFRTYVSIVLNDTDRETTVLCVGGPDCQELAARDADWLQCENCRTWWHRACSGQEDKGRTFYCSSCSQRILAIDSISRKKEREEEVVVDEEEEEEEEEEDEGEDEGEINGEDAEVGDVEIDGD